MKNQMEDIRNNADITKLAEIPPLWANRSGVNEEV